MSMHTSAGTISLVPLYAVRASGEAVCGQRMYAYAKWYVGRGCDILLHRLYCLVSSKLHPVLTLNAFQKLLAAERCHAVAEKKQVGHSLGSLPSHWLHQRSSRNPGSEHTSRLPLCHADPNLRTTACPFSKPTKSSKDIRWRHM